MYAESKKDLFLKRVQVTIAILAGLATLTVGLYNVRKIASGKDEPREIIVKEVPVKQTSELQSAIESTSASWIRKLAAEGESKIKQQ